MYEARALAVPSRCFLLEILSYRILSYLHHGTGVAVIGAKERRICRWLAPSNTGITEVTSLGAHGRSGFEERYAASTPTEASVTP